MSLFLLGSHERIMQLDWNTIGQISSLPLDIYEWNRKESIWDNGNMWGKKRKVKVYI